MCKFMSLFVPLQTDDSHVSPKMSKESQPSLFVPLQTDDSHVSPKMSKESQPSLFVPLQTDDSHVSPKMDKESQPSLFVPLQTDDSHVSPKMSKESKQSPAMERRFSHRLARKRRISRSPEKHKLEEKLIPADEIKTEESSVPKIRNKDSRSKSFLDCLELQPVGLDSQTEASSKDSNNKSDINSDIAMKHFLNDCPKRKSKKVAKRCSKVCPQSVKISGQATGNKYDKTHVSDAENTQEITLVPHNDCSDLNMRHSESSSQDMTASDSGKENHMVKDVKFADVNVLTEKGGEINSQVYMFRDVNKVAHGIGPDESSADPFVTVDLNRHGKKRRYDKLIQNLADSEKNLEINLKGVKHEDMKNADISLSVERMKEKLRVREKKKYEYLINYMRDQWRVDQKCFKDILPQKVDLVQENVERQLGVKMDNIVYEKRKRGRPRKINIEGDKTAYSSSDEKKSQLKHAKQSNCRKKKDSGANKSFPVTFPKTLLSDTSASQNRQKVEKFRIGIIDKNGDQEFIELNSDTLEGVPFCRIKDSVSDAFNQNDKQDMPANLATKTRGRKIGAEHAKTAPTDGLENTKIESKFSSYSSGDNSQILRPQSNKVCDEMTLEVVGKYPPTTISLPSISSLERDYELVSLSPPCPAQTGNFHADHFFIPQSTFDQDGKTSMIIVGPFCLVCDPKPRLLLVSPDKRKKGPTMILRKKIHSPSNTPPRDFRIHKESRWVRTSYKPSPGNDGGQQVDPSVIFLDHNYMTPLEMKDSVRRYCKAVAKYSANVKFIDARVENITEEADNFVVTIKGDNMLQQVKNITSLSQAPLTCNKDGMPVVYSLSQIMTPALIKADQSAKREQLALQSQQTGDYTPVMFPFSAMGDVVMEVLIPPGGTELLPRSSSRHQQFLQESPEVNRPVSYPARLEALNDSGDTNFLHQEGVTIIEDSPKQEVVLEETLEELEKDEDHVVIENAEAVDNGSLPGLPCCRVCLRLFPSDYMLFMHVRSNHPACEATDSIYLEELRARSHLICPICCNPPAFLATPAKLKRHLRVNHGIEHYLEICRVCHAEFLDKKELDMHTELCHNTFAGRRLVSLLKSHQMDHLTRQAPLFSGYMFCSRCNIMFNDRVSLLSHTLRAHPELNQLNLCGLCDHLFESTLSLHKHLKKAHEQTHDGALKCPFCPAWLSSMELASIHRITLHTGAVPVHCPFCGSGYQNLHLMYRHVRSQHLLTEVHICPECQVSFPTSRLLSEHMRKAHMGSPRIMKENSHTVGNMTYCCPFCTMAFMRTYDLAVHVINAHRDCLLPSQCQLCMQSFVSDEVMRTHMVGAHGIDTSTDISYVDGHFEDGQSVTVVLQDDGEDVYTHTKDLETDDHGRTLMRGHLMDTQDILDSQETDQYIGLDDQETIVYLTERNHIVGSGEIFGGCSSMVDDDQLLSDTNDDFNFHGVDYLETLTNDSIAVGADVVADVSMDEITINGDINDGQGNRNQDILELTSQFEIDGVLYELSTEHDNSEVVDVSTIEAPSLRLSCVEASDLAKLWRHANLS